MPGSDQNVSGPESTLAGARAHAEPLQGSCQAQMALEAPYCGGGAEQGAESSAPASGTTGTPRFAQAPLGRYATPNQPPAVLAGPVNGTAHKLTFRGHPTFGAPKAAPAVWYGVVRADGVARALRATYEGVPGTRGQGRWLDAGGVALPSGVLLFDSAPACRGWMVANMGATTRGYTEQGEPLGVTP